MLAPPLGSWRPLLGEILDPPLVMPPPLGLAPLLENPASVARFLCIALKLSTFQRFILQLCFLCCFSEISFQ